MNHWRIWGAIAAGAVILVVFSCSNEGGGILDNLLKGSKSAVPVTVANVAVVERQRTIDVPTTLEPSDEMVIKLPQEATIERLLVAEGDLVESGDRLFTISETDLTLQLARLRADLKEAQAALEKNQYFLNNRDRLLDEGRIDRNQYDNLEAEVDGAEAEVEKIQLEITGLEDRQGTPTITAPISGTVGNIAVANGATAAADAPILTIVATDPMIATFRLGSHETTAVRPGQSVSLRITDLGGERMSGRITAVGSALDAEKRFEVKASVPNRVGYLKAGMTAQMEFRSDRKQRLYMIPEEALIRDRRRYYVFTVIKGAAHKIQVLPSETRGSRVEIAKGLREDDLVVVKGHDKLTEGAVVDIWGR